MDRDRWGREVIGLLIGIFVALLCIISSLKNIEKKLAPPVPAAKVIECEQYLVPEREPVRVVRGWDGFI